MTQTARAPGSASVEIDAAKLREARQEQGLTQVKLAKLSGISDKYLSQLETGYRKRVSPPTYVALCEALKIAPTRRRKLRKVAAS